MTQEKKPDRSRKTIDKRDKLVVGGLVVGAVVVAAPVTAFAVGTFVVVGAVAGAVGLVDLLKSN